MKKISCPAFAKYLLSVTAMVLANCLSRSISATPITVPLNICLSDSASVDTTAVTVRNIEDVVFVVVEDEPTFPDGKKALLQFFAANLRYPEDCIEQKVHGRVTIGFIVEPDGSITNIEPLRSPDARLSVEAMRLISSMPKWTPGKQRGRVVRVKYMVPVTFRLDAVVGESSAAATSIDISIKPETIAHGFGSSSPNGDPIIVVGRKVYPLGIPLDLNPDKIASMDVCNDEATIRKYIDKYPDAKNGVVIIKLKK